MIKGFARQLSVAITQNSHISVVSLSPAYTGHFSGRKCMHGTQDVNGGFFLSGIHEML